MVICNTDVGYIRYSKLTLINDKNSDVKMSRLLQFLNEKGLNFVNQLAKISHLNYLRNLPLTSIR